MPFNQMFYQDTLPVGSSSLTQGYDTTTIGRKGKNKKLNTDDCGVFTYLTHLDSNSQKFQDRVFRRNNPFPKTRDQLIQPRLTPYASLYFNRDGYDTQMRPPRVIEEEIPSMVDTAYRQALERFFDDEQIDPRLQLARDLEDFGTPLARRILELKRNIEQQLPPNIPNEVRNQVLANAINQALQGTSGTTGTAGTGRIGGIQQTLAGQTGLNPQASIRQQLQFQSTPTAPITPQTDRPPQFPISREQLQDIRSNLRRTMAGAIQQERLTEQRFTPFQLELMEATQRQRQRLPPPPELTDVIIRQSDNIQFPEVRERPDGRRAIERGLRRGRTTVSPFQQSSINFAMRQGTGRDRAFRPIQ